MDSIRAERKEESKILIRAVFQGAGQNGPPRKALPLYHLAMGTFIGLFVLCCKKTCLKYVFSWRSRAFTEIRKKKRDKVGNL